MTSRMNRPWVLISGASSGFGQATATLLASRGWNLLLTSRRADRLEEVAASCRQHGAEVHVEAWDVRDRASTDAGVATLMKRANVGQGEGQTSLHALVNNAGLAVGKGPFDEGLDDDWNRMIDTNVKGVLFLARACVAYMFAGSRMVNMAAETEFSVVRFKGDQAAANAVYQGFDPLLARDIAEAVEFILSRPRHVNINDLVIMPTAQASAHHLIRS